MDSVVGAPPNSLLIATLTGVGVVVAIATLWYTRNEYNLAAQGDYGVYGVHEVKEERLKSLSTASRPESLRVRESKVAPRDLHQEKRISLEGGKLDSL